MNNENFPCGGLIPWGRWRETWNQLSLAIKLYKGVCLFVLRQTMLTSKPTHVEIRLNGENSSNCVELTIGITKVFLTSKPWTNEIIWIEKNVSNCVKLTIGFTNWRCFWLRNPTYWKPFEERKMFQIVSN